MVVGDCVSTRIIDSLYCGFTECDDLVVSRFEYSSYSVVFVELYLLTYDIFITIENIY